MAWNRLVELKIGESGTGLLVSDLDIQFSVRRSVTFSNNNAGIRIFNAKESTRNKILKIGNNVVLGVGYEDEHQSGNLPTIFIGNILFAMSRKTGADWITDIEVSMMQTAKASLESLAVSLSYTKGVPISKPIEEIASVMGLAVNGQANLANLTLINGWAFAGTPRQGLADLRNRLRPHSLDLFVDNSEVIIYRVGTPKSTFETVLLTPDSGLLKVDVTNRQDKIGDKAEEYKKRIRFASLLNPKLQPNGLITISGVNSSVNGTYLVEKVNFKGNNFGGPFDAIGEAVA